MSIERVLVVDDSPTDLHLITGYLRKHGYQALAVTNGADAISTAKSERPDLILMDIVMPEMNGFEVCKNLRYAGVNTPIIMLTAKGQEIDRVLGPEMGADDYVTKPFSPRELQARVKAIMGRTDSKKYSDETPKFIFNTWK